jgi:hypothetical protein
MDHNLGSVKQLVTPSCLLLLPVEILLLILLFVKGCSFKDLLSLRMCNKMIADLARPLIYESISIKPKVNGLELPEPTMDAKTIALSNSLLANLAFRQGVKHVELDFWCVGHEDCFYEWHFERFDVPGSQAWLRALHMTEILPNVRSLMIEQGGDERSAALGLTFLGRCLQNMALLEHITLENLPLDQVMSVLQLLQPLSKLKTLSLSCQNVTEEAIEARSLDWNKLHKSGREQLVHLKLSKMSNSEAFAQGRFPGLLVILLSWCKRPGALSLEGLAQESFPESSSIQSILLDLPAGNMLRELHIHCAADRPEVLKPKIQQLRINNLSSLQKLSLTNWLPDASDSPLDVYQAFLSGSVRYMEWTYDEGLHIRVPERYLLDTEMGFLKNAGLAEVDTILQAFQYVSTSPLERFKFKICLRDKQVNAQGYLLHRNPKPTMRHIKQLESELEMKGIVATCVGNIEGSR